MVILVELFPWWLEQIGYMVIVFLISCMAASVLLAIILIPVLMSRAMKPEIHLEIEEDEEDKD